MRHSQQSILFSRAVSINGACRKQGGRGQCPMMAMEKRGGGGRDSVWGGGFKHTSTRSPLRRHSNSTKLPSRPSGSCCYRPCWPWLVVVEEEAGPAGTAWAPGPEGSTVPGAGRIGLEEDIVPEGVRSSRNGEHGRSVSWATNGRG